MTRPLLEETAVNLVPHWYESLPDQPVHDMSAHLGSRPCLLGGPDGAVLLRTRIRLLLVPCLLAVFFPAVCLRRLRAAELGQGRLRLRSETPTADSSLRYREQVSTPSYLTLAANILSPFVSFQNLLRSPLQQRAKVGEPNPPCDLLS